MSDRDLFDELRRSSSERPGFIIVCDHGVRGDHADCDHAVGCREVDQVGRLPWFPTRPGWWAAENTDTDSVVVHSLIGNELGYDPWEMFGETAPEPGQQNRENIEIRCRNEACRKWALRFDDAMLQRVLNAALTLIVTQQDYREAYTPSVSNSRVVVTLQGLWFAHRHAKRQ